MVRRLLLVALALAAAGCGTSALRSGARHADLSPAGVIRGWSEALRRGDVNAAANFFALPSVFVNGTDPAGNAIAVRIRNHAEAVAVNESLSCGAELTSTRTDGRFVLAAFILTERRGPGAGCGAGTGQQALTDFVIRHGRIVDWIRAPDGGGPPVVPTTPAPASPASRAAVV